MKVELEKPPSDARPARHLFAWWGTLLAALAILGGAGSYRVLEQRFGSEELPPIRLDPPLTSLPMEIGAWQGEDVEVPAGIQRIARNDDFINRRYRDANTGAAVNLYVGYTARPRTMLRHRPSVCYPSAGWLPMAPERNATVPDDGTRVLVHHFRKGELNDSQIVVLNYYILNGAETADEAQFWGLAGRAPNAEHDRSRYVAQVQVMVPVGQSVDEAEQRGMRFLKELKTGLYPILPGAAATLREGSVR